MTRFEQTGRMIRIQTHAGNAWIEAREEIVLETDAPHLRAGMLQWGYRGNDCGGGLDWSQGPVEVEAFLRSYIGRERVVVTKEGF